MFKCNKYIYSKAFISAVTWPGPKPAHHMDTFSFSHNEQNNIWNIAFYSNIVPRWIAKFNQKCECFNAIVLCWCLFFSLSSLCYRMRTFIFIPTFISDHYSISTCLKWLFCVYYNMRKRWKINNNNNFVTKSV